MSEKLSEEEMRLALFGPSAQSDQESPAMPEPKVVQTPQAASKLRPTAKALSPKLRVTMRASKEFEGDVEIFTYDANTLSTIVAEQEAKNAAKKQKFKYFDVMSVNPI